MKLFKGLLLGSAAALTGVAGVSGARAADLPARAAAPIEYVRICDAYGAGFFYIPGTETCLRVGGLVLGEVRDLRSELQHWRHRFLRQWHSGLPYRTRSRGRRLPVWASFRASPNIPTIARAMRRASTPWAGSNSTPGRPPPGAPCGPSRGSIPIMAPAPIPPPAALRPSSNTWNTTAGTSSQRESTIINKAFIQFAGLTAGRAQSMFDFYADAYNWVNVRGSNATVALFSYTATFGSGFSSTISFEDQPSRRAAIGSTIASATATAAGAPIPINVGGITGTSFQGQPAGARVPDIVGNLRLDQPWGAVQMSAAAHQIRASLFGSTALGTPPATGAGLTPAYAFPALVSNSYGFAVQGGIQLNADFLSPGDKFWLQAAYEKGAFGYIAGNNLGYNYGAVNQNRYAGSGFTASDYSTGWNSQPNSDCVFTGSGSCEQQWGWDITGAYKHYWIPTLSSAVYGSYMEVHYSANALSGFGGGVGISNIKEGRVGTNLIWTPLKGFDIGGEFMYVHVNQSRPAGLVPDATLVAVGLPAFRPNQSQYEGRIRVQRAF